MESDIGLITRSFEQRWHEHGNVLETFPSMQDVARSLGIPPQGISACYRGIKKTTEDFRWTYLRDMKDFDKNFGVDLKTLNSGDY